MFTLETVGEIKYLHSRTPEVLISTPREAMDILASGYPDDVRRFLFWETNFAPDFYDLKTRLAGEVLQKFSNYSVKAAILGTFALPGNPRFQEFVFESNQGRQLRFAREEAEAVEWLIR